MTVALTWIGQAGFLLRTPATRLALDPFLSDHPDRRFPAPVGVDDLAGTELVLASHQHLDHLDAPALVALLERDDRARVVVPAPVVPDAVEAGLSRDRLVGARPGEPLAAGDVTVHPVPALHGVHAADAYTHGLTGDGDQVRYLGYVLGDPGRPAVPRRRHPALARPGRAAGRPVRPAVRPARAGAGPGYRAGSTAYSCQESGTPLSR
jgi:L-ascorbate 6-phosphate lactonase